MSMEGLVSDGETLLLEHLLPKYGNTLPFFIFGHSMGSIVACLLANKLSKHEQFNGFITSGIALHPGHGSFRPLGMRCLYCLEGVIKSLFTIIYYFHFINILLFKYMNTYI